MVIFLYRDLQAFYINRKINKNLKLKDVQGDRFPVENLGHSIAKEAVGICKALDEPMNNQIEVLAEKSNTWSKK